EPLGLARAVCGIEVVPSGLAGCVVAWSLVVCQVSCHHFGGAQYCDGVAISGSRRRCTWVPIATAPGCRVVFCLPEVDGGGVLPVVDDEAAGITGLGRVKPLCRRQRLLGAGDRRGGGRDAQSIAFLSWPGTDPLYCGVANNSPSASAMAWRRSVTPAGAGAASRSSLNGGRRPGRPRP